MFPVLRRRNIKAALEKAGAPGLQSEWRSPKPSASAKATVCAATRAHGGTERRERELSLAPGCSAAPPAEVQALGFILREVK